MSGEKQFIWGGSLFIAALLLMDIIHDYPGDAIASVLIYALILGGLNWFVGMIRWMLE